MKIKHRIQHRNSNQNVKSKSQAEGPTGRGPTGKGPTKAQGKVPAQMQGKGPTRAQGKGPTSSRAQQVPKKRLPTIKFRYEPKRVNVGDVSFFNHFCFPKVGARKVAAVVSNMIAQSELTGEDKLTLIDAVTTHSNAAAEMPSARQPLQPFPNPEDYFTEEQWSCLHNGEIMLQQKIHLVCSHLGRLGAHFLDESSWVAALSIMVYAYPRQVVGLNAIQILAAFKATFRQMKKRKVFPTSSSGAFPDRFPASPNEFKEKFPLWWACAFPDGVGPVEFTGPRVALEQTRSMLPQRKTRRDCAPQMSYSTQSMCRSQKRQRSIDAADWGIPGFRLCNPATQTRGELGDRAPDRLLDREEDLPQSPDVRLALPDREMQASPCLSSRSSPEAVATRAPCPIVDRSLSAQAVATGPLWPITGRSLRAEALATKAQCPIMDRTLGGGELANPTQGHTVGSDVVALRGSSGQEAPEIPAAVVSTAVNVKEKKNVAGMVAALCETMARKKAAGSSGKKKKKKPAAAKKASSSEEESEEEDKGSVSEAETEATKPSGGKGTVKAAAKGKAATTQQGAKPQDELKYKGTKKMPPRYYGRCTIYTGPSKWRVRLPNVEVEKTFGFASDPEGTWKKIVKLVKQKA